MKENSVDVWNDYLNTLENRGYASVDWEVASDVQEKLIEYFKAKIDEGVSDGKTSLPPDLIEYIYRFPKEMRWALRVHAEGALESDPDNGAAAKFLAIETLQVFDVTVPLSRKRPLVEKAMMLLSKDVEICFFAFTKYGFCEDEEVLKSLERMFERLQETSQETQYRWVYRILYDYSEVWFRPTDLYEGFKTDDPLIERWNVVFSRIQTILEKQLAQKPNDWSASRMLTEIHETLGDTDAVRAVLKEAQPVFEKILEQVPDDWTALSALANIHEKLGNAELSRQYRIKRDPTLAWEEQILPDFPASTVDLDGNPISLMDYRGKVVLLDFWAVWCGPCVGEIPNVKEVYEKYHDKGFDVIGVSFDKDEAVVREFIKKEDIPWRQILDSEGFGGVFAKQYGVRGIPAPFLIDRNGKVISVKARNQLLGELVASEIEGKKEEI
ncbi:MAG: redoxin family protein [Candidatus Poribacteria bacterium]|nr:redoxin family protein [Candidatus Poribacteria bacterium]